MIVTSPVAVLANIKITYPSTSSASLKTAALQQSFAIALDRDPK